MVARTTLGHRPQHFDNVKNVTNSHYTHIKCLSRIYQYRATPTKTQPAPMGNVWSSVDPATPANDPLASPVVDIMHELTVEQQSLMNPRTNRATICGDVVQCIRRYVDAPQLIALTRPLIERNSLDNMLQSTDPTYGLSVFNMGADTDAQKWTHYVFDYARPMPLCCDIASYAHHTVAMINGAVPAGEYKVTNTCIDSPHGFKQHANASFLWSCASRSSVSPLPPMPSARWDVNSIMINDSLVVYGCADDVDDPSCNILRDKIWSTSRIARLPTMIKTISAKLPIHASALVLSGSSSAWMIDFNQLTATRRENHTYGYCYIHSLSATTLDANSIYICQSVQFGDGDTLLWGPGNIKHYDIRLDKFTQLASIPVQFAPNFKQSSVALDENCIALLGSSHSTDMNTPAFDLHKGVAIHRPVGNPKLQPDCWIYDARADAWRQEPRWAIGHDILSTLKM